MEPKLIWANYASSDLKKTTAFYTALGFKPNGTFTAEATSFLFGQNGFVINFFTEARLKKEANGNIGFPTNGNEVIFSLSAKSKEEVDLWFEKVKLAGGKIFANPQKYDEGYTFGFSDPDDHKFNVLYWPGM